METISPKQAARTLRLAQIECERNAWYERMKGKPATEVTPADILEGERLLIMGKLRSHFSEPERQSWGWGTAKRW